MPEAITSCSCELNTACEHLRSKKDWPLQIATAVGYVLLCGGIITRVLSLTPWKIPDWLNMLSWLSLGLGLLTALMHLIVRTIRVTCRHLIGKVCPYALPMLSPHINPEIVRGWIHENGVLHATRVQYVENHSHVKFDEREEHQFLSLLEHLLSRESRRIRSLIAYDVIPDVYGDRLGKTRNRFLKSDFIKYLPESVRKLAVLKFPSRTFYDQANYDYNTMLPVTSMLYNVQALGLSIRHVDESWWKQNDHFRLGGARYVEEDVATGLVRLETESNDLVFLLVDEGFRRAPQWYVASSQTDRTGRFHKGVFGRCDDDDVQLLSALEFIADDIQEWHVADEERVLHHALVIDQAEEGECILAADWAFALGESWESDLYDAIRTATTRALSRGVELKRLFVAASEEDLPMVEAEIARQVPLQLVDRTSEHFRWTLANKATQFWKHEHGSFGRFEVAERGLDFAAMPSRGEMFYNLFDGTRKSTEQAYMQERLEWFGQIWVNSAPVADLPQDDSVEASTEESDDRELPAVEGPEPDAE